MSASGGKIITALRDRWQIEQEIKGMLDAHSEEEFSNRAWRVAASGDQVIPVILSHLNRTDARMLSALGAVASLYPHREQILNRLYQAAADLTRPDRGRVSAMLILERFLGQEPDPYLIETLDDPQVIAVESIREMMREGEREPHVLIEYARSLAAQPEETIQGIVETLLEVGKERAVPALCLLAQEDEDVMAKAALFALGRLYHPDAARGLQSIIPLLPPTYRSWGERSLRKLRFNQVLIPPLPPVDDTWRALVSSVDGEGNQVVWFIQDPDEQGNCRFLGLSISEVEGIKQAYGNPHTPAGMLPERRQLGHVHGMTLEQGASAQTQVHSSDTSPLPPRQEETVLYMLEADFDYGRRLVREGQAHNFERGYLLPAEYRLLGPWLWQYNDVQVDLSQRLPLMPARILDALAETASLLLYPPFRGWFARGDRALQYARAMFQRSPSAIRVGSRSGSVKRAAGQGAAVSLAVEKLATEYFDEATIHRLRARLETMGEWLWRAGDVHLARLAMVAATTITLMSPAEHPLTRGMAELGLYVVVNQLQEQFNLETLSKMRDQNA